MVETLTFNRATIFGIRGTFQGYVDSTLSYSTLGSISTNFNQLWNYSGASNLDFTMVSGGALSSDKATILYNNGFRWIVINATFGLYDNNSSGGCWGWCEFWWVNGSNWTLYGRNGCHWSPGRSSTETSMSASYSYPLSGSRTGYPRISGDFDIYNNVLQYCVLKSWSITLTK